MIVNLGEIQNFSFYIRKSDFEEKDNFIKNDVVSEIKRK